MDNKSHYLLDQVTTEVFKNETIPGNISNKYNLLYYILITSFGAIITISNLAVLFSSCSALRRGKEGKCVYLLLGNMALAAVLNGIIIIFVQLFPGNLRNHRICSWQIGQVLSSAIVSIYCVGCIAVERFLYIIYGLHYERWQHIFKLQVILSVIWIVGSCIAYLPLMGWSGNTNNGQDCWFIVVAPKNLVVTTVILSTLPLLLVIFLYSIISYNALKGIIKSHLSLKSNLNSQSNNISRLRPFRNKTKQFPVLDNNPTHFVPKIFNMRFSKSVNTSKRWKSVKVVIFPTTSFFFSWYLYMIVSLFYVSACNDHSTKRCKSFMLVLASPLLVLGFVNSLLHPILYAWWHKGFNRFFKKRVGSIRLKNTRQGNGILPNTYPQATILQRASENATNV